MIALENIDAPVRSGDAVPVVYPANGSLRPKRRWKSDPVEPAQEVSREQSADVVREPRFHHHRMKKSGQPHRIYPQVVAQITPTPSSVPAMAMAMAMAMAHQILNLVRSFSFR